MKRTTLIAIFFLILASLACTLSAAKPGNTNSVKNEVALLSRSIVASLYFVCTGATAGRLNVRECPGVACQPVAAISEGTPVNLTGDTSWQNKSNWVELSAPVPGWVNARYLCQQK